MSQTSEFIPAPKREDFTFAQLIQGREVEYPTLARAARNTKQATSTQVEWLVDEFRDGALHTAAWKNFTQIFRHPYRGATPEGSTSAGGDSNADKARHDFLSAVEKSLIHGVPFKNTEGLPWATCGGYRHYLNRDLNSNDILSLRPLREPFLWTHDWKFSPDHGWYALDTPEYEWLAEVSLVVFPQEP